MNEFIGLLIWLAERLTPDVVEVDELLLGDIDDADDADEDEDDDDEIVVAVVADEAFVSVLHVS
jgi:hypothetical protein